jgi:lsr operon transcriptional repressor
MLGRVAALHYTHGLTHQQVGELVGLSRVQVTRMLARARAEGIVEIRVHSDEAIFPELQIAVQEMYQIENVWIAPTFPTEKETQESIGKVGAEYLRTIMKPRMTVAVGLSGTLALIAPHLGREHIDVTFVPAIGSRPSSHGSANPHEVANLLAEAVGGTARHLPAPFLASSPESAITMRAEPDVKENLILAREADIGIFGIGGVKRGSGILLETVGTDAVIVELKSGGAVGDISAAFFDSNGRPVKSSLDSRIIGLSIEEILALPKRVAFAGGKEKFFAIASAIESGLVNALVTDQETAQALLDRKK